MTSEQEESRLETDDWGDNKRKSLSYKHGWEMKELKNVAEINPGSINNASFDFNSINYLDISSTAKGFIEELSHYNLDEAPSRAKRTVDTGDTVISRVRPAREQFTLIRDPEPNLVVSTGFGVLRPKKGIDEKYLYYAVTTPEMIRWMENHTSGSAYPAVNIGTLKHAEIPVPPNNTQQKIGEILYKLDLQMSINRQNNDILEEMAQALFRSRFVDFDPYDEFKQSELGDVPEEFEIKELSEILSLEYGDGLSKDDRAGDKHPVYGSNGINGSHSDYLIEGPGIIVGRKGTIGTVNYEPRDFWCIDTTFYLEPKREYDMLFYYHLLKNGVRLKHLGSDSAVPGLNRNTVHDQKVAIPSEERIAEFTQLVKPMYEIKEENRRENKYLEELRDTLLPKLMSGQIRVTDIELDELEVDSEV